MTNSYNEQAFLMWSHFVKGKSHVKQHLTDGYGRPSPPGAKLKGSPSESRIELGNLKDATTIHKIGGKYQPEEVIPMLMRDKKASFKHFIDLPTHKISYLVPEIKLYKISGGIYKPFYFTNKADTATMQSVLERGTLGVTGIKSFDISFTGTDFFTADKIIECTLDIYTDNINNLFAKPPGASAKLVELFAIFKKKKIKIQQGMSKEIPAEHVRDPSENEIVAVLGYALPPEAHRIFTKFEIKAIEKSKLTLRMNYNRHDISIGQDGTANINISYNSRIDYGASASNSFLDLMKSDLDLISMSKNFAFEKKSLLSAGDAKGKEKKVKDLQREIAESTRTEFRKYLEFLDLENTKDTRLYDALIQPAEIRDFLDHDTEVVKKEDTTSEPPPETDAAAQATKQNIAKLKNEPDPQVSDETSDLIHSQRQISYVYFGDLLESVIYNIKKNIDSALAGIEKSKEKKKKEMQAHLRKAQNELKSFKIMLGNVELNGQQHNLADIPISLSLYQKFVFENIEQQHRTSYSLTQFLNSCVNKLLPDAISESFKYKDSPGIDFDVPLKSIVVTGENIKRNKIDIKLKDMPRFLFEKSAKKKSDETDYFIIYQDISPKDAIARQGSRIKDNSKGIYHLHLGKNRGLVKNIDFQMYDIPYRKESLMIESVSLYDQLKMPYTATITMVGNNLFLPGSLVFVNPSSIGFGDPKNLNSGAARLGLGGYYQIISVKTTLSGQEMETVLTTGHNISFSGKDPFANQNIIKSPSLNVAKESEKIESPQTESADSIPPYLRNTDTDPYSAIKNNEYITDSQKKLIIADHEMSGRSNIGSQSGIQRTADDDTITYVVTNRDQKVLVKIRKDNSEISVMREI